MADATSSERTGAQQRDELERFRALFDQAPSFAAVLSGPEHRFVLTNPAYQTLIAHRPVLGLTVREAMPEAAGQGLSDLLDQVFRSGEAYVGRNVPVTLLRTPGGEPEVRRLDVVYQPIRDRSGVVTSIFVEGSDTTEQHAALEALRESQARLRSAQEAGGVGVFAVRLEDGLLEASPELCRIYGVPECDTMLAADLERLVLPDDAHIASDGQRRRDGEVPSLAEYRIRRAGDGEVRWISRRAEFERGEDGRRTRLVGVVQDVTEQRAARQAVEDSEARFRAFSEAVPNQVWSATPEGGLSWVNQRGVDYFGDTEALLHGDRWTANVHPDDIAQAGVAWSAALGSGVDYETEFRLRDLNGVYRWHLARARALRGPDGEVTGWIGTNTDIDEQRTARDALKELNATLEARVEQRTRERDRAWKNSRDLQLVVDEAGVFQAANEAWLSILGWTPEEVVGRSYLDFIHPDDHPSSEGALATAASGELAPYENRYRHREGGWRWLSWVAAPDNGLIYASGRHVTTEREARAALAEAQEQLRQAQKMEAVGQLTGGIAHDFNNLLTGVTGSLELMRTRIAQGRFDAVDRYIHVAEGAAKRAAALTQRLLAFSRRQTLDPKPTNLNRLVAGMEEILRRTVGPSVEVEIVGAGGLWTTLVDAGQLDNALLNLCINARDAMPAGGRITVETANKWLDDRASATRDLPPGQYVSLCVTDTGTGMTPEVVARAFDPFFTTKPMGQGTGLGLSMIYGFARQSGGQVRIYSEVGQGTTMCIYLPRHVGAEDADGPPGLPAPSSASGAGETVLVVDDEPSVRMLVVEILEEEGYTALEAGDGPTGLRFLESDARVDLLVTDVGLPGGMNGRQLADAGRVLRQGLKVLFITGYAENAAVGNGHLEPGMEVVTKPFAMDQLATKIRGMIES